MDNIPRHIQNHGSLTKSEVAKRNCAVKDLSIKYPRISPFYLELLYDWLVDMTDEERTNAINSDTDVPRPSCGEVVGSFEIIKA
jgi:hypothetical protein